MKKTTLENLQELKEKLPSFHDRSNVIRIQKYNSYIEQHLYEQDEKLIDKRFNQYLESLDPYFNDFFNFYKHNDDYYKVYNKIIFLIDTFIENETNLELKKLEDKKSILSKVKPLEENLSDLNKSSIRTNKSDSEEINSLKEKVSSLEERIKKLENKSSINDILGPNRGRIGGQPYEPYPFPQPEIPYKPITPYYTLSSTGEINKKEN